MNIRTATIQDAESLSDLGRKSFFEKWKESTSVENMKHYLADTFTAEKIEQEISEPGVIYLVAEENKTIVGYAKLMHTHPDIQEEKLDIIFSQEHPLEISRLYVSPELIGKSIGAKLMERIFEIAAQEDCDLIWLGVWEKNPAVHFYQRHGFIKAGTHEFIFGDQVDIDTVMVKQL